MHISDVFGNNFNSGCTKVTISGLILDLEYKNVPSKVIIIYLKIETALLLLWNIFCRLRNLKVFFSIIMKITNKVPKCP